MKNIIYQGVVAYADRFAACKDYIYFVSVCGPRQAVEANLSAITCQNIVHLQISGEPAFMLDISLIEIDHNYTMIERIWDSKARYKIYSLSRGRAHGYFMDTNCILKDIKSKAIIVGINEDEAKRKFNLVLKKIPVPYITEWQDWYIKRLKEEGLLEKLICHNCYAFKLNMNEDKFLKIITDGIKEKLIQF